MGIDTGLGYKYTTASKTKSVLVELQFCVHCMLNGLIWWVRQAGCALLGLAQLGEVGDQRSLKLGTDMTPTYSGGSKSCFLTWAGLGVGLDSFCREGLAQVAGLYFQFTVHLG